MGLLLIKLSTQRAIYCIPYNFDKLLNICIVVVDPKLTAPSSEPGRASVVPTCSRNFPLTVVWLSICTISAREAWQRVACIPSRGRGGGEKGERSNTPCCFKPWKPREAQDKWANWHKYKMFFTQSVCLIDTVLKL